MVSGGCSVDPGHGHPLRRGAHARERGLQLRQRVVDVVVDDGHVEVVPVRAPQLLRLARQHLQRPVVLGHEKYIKYYNEKNERQCEAIGQRPDYKCNDCRFDSLSQYKKYFTSSF